MAKRMETIEDVISEMNRLKSNLPPRPDEEEVALAKENVKREELILAARLEDLLQRPRPPAVPQHVWRAYQQMREDVLRSKVEDERKNAEAKADIAKNHKKYDSLIETVKLAAASPLKNSAVQGSAYDYRAHTPEGSKHISLDPVCEDLDQQLPDLRPLEKNERSLSIGRLGGRSFKGSQSTSITDSGPRTTTRLTFSQEAATPGGQPSTDDQQDEIREYSPQVLQAIERSKIKKATELKIASQRIKWLPELIGELTTLTSLDVSANNLQALPESICELINLTFLDVHSNQLKALPDSLGCLTNLRYLDISSNNIEELAVIIGLLTKVVEFRADWNKLIVLPEATSGLTSVEVLSVKYNTLKSLPTTMNLLTNLKELDVRFNRLEGITESLCSLPQLTKLDVSSNFQDLKALPVRIGELQSLRELYATNCAITVLPKSFRFLTGLQKLELDKEKLVFPPGTVYAQGIEALLQYMNDVEPENPEQEKDKKGTAKKSGFLSVFKKSKSKQVDPLLRTRS